MNMVAFERHLGQAVTVGDQAAQRLVGRLYELAVQVDELADDLKTRAGLE